MKKAILVFVIFLGVLFANGQQEKIVSLKQELNKSINDTARFSILDSLGIYYLYFTTKQDSAFFYFNEIINTAFLLKDINHQILGYARMGLYFIWTAHYKSSIEISLKGIKLLKQNNIPYYLSALYYNISAIYLSFENLDIDLKYAYEGEHYLKDYKDPYFDQRILSLTLIGDAYAEKKIFDSVYYYFNKAQPLALASKDPITKDLCLWYWGEYYLYIKNYKKADSIFYIGIKQCKEDKDYQWLGGFYLFSAQSLMEQDKLHEAIPIGHLALAVTRSVRNKSWTALSATLLYTTYDRLRRHDSALYYVKLRDSINAEIVNSDINYQVQETNFTQQLNDKEEHANQILATEKYKNTITLYVFLTASGFFLLIAAILWRNNRQRKRSNSLLHRQKQEIQTTLTELRSAQAQLIQSEKMASLGELTAGIAHEIQNPLNFVNNFSEVNLEMNNELKGKLDKLQIATEDKMEIDDLMTNIEKNDQKIIHHGKRADAIVKGMLQHSRSSTGQKELTDINSLADEYLRLSYHGLRAKDKSFNATIKTDFDRDFSSVEGKINIIPQDISRVLLNLYNNAFYAVTQKKAAFVKASAASSAEALTKEEYEPTVLVSTKKINSKIEIRVKDNGIGIPQKVIDKIFQPFFTTKPTGQGTGLGLSLSYDIIKAHGGIITVETKIDEFTEFIIQLPLNNH